MSVHNHPKAWAREMDRMMGKGEINKDNYQTDCANAVVYVRESADKIEQLERELTAMRTTASKAMADYETANRGLANCKAVAEIQSERVRKLEEELTAMTAHDAWQREQWEKMVSHGVGLQERLREAKAERDSMLKEKELWTAANSDMARIAEERNRLEKERDALIAENALTQRACDSWRKLAMDRLDERNALAEENDWHPIETAPKNGMTVQLLCPGGVDTGHWCDYRDRGYEINGEWSTEHGHGEPCKWKPLPQPPKGQP